MSIFSRLFNKGPEDDDKAPTDPVEIPVEGDVAGSRAQVAPAEAATLPRVERPAEPVPPSSAQVATSAQSAPVVGPTPEASPGRLRSTLSRTPGGDTPAHSSAAIAAAAPVHTPPPSRAALPSPPSVGAAAPSAPRSRESRSRAPTPPPLRVTAPSTASSTTQVTLPQPGPPSARAADAGAERARVTGSASAQGSTSVSRSPSPSASASAATSGSAGAAGKGPAAVNYALLQHVPGMTRAVGERMASAGIASIDALFALTIKDLVARVGLPRDLAARIVERIAAVHDKRTSDRRAERAQLAEDVAKLRKIHGDYERLEDRWSDTEEQKKRSLRQARADALARVLLLVARTGGVQLVEEIEPLPFGRKLERLERMVKESGHA